MALAGFVLLLFMIGVGVYSSVTISRFENQYREMGLGGRGTLNSAGAAVAVMYIIMAAIAFFPLLFTFRFAGQMMGALRNNDQALLNASFQNLKVCFRYLGIVAIISLVLIALSLFMGIAGLALNS